MHEDALPPRVAERLQERPQGVGMAVDVTDEVVHGKEDSPVGESRHGPPSRHSGAAIRSIQYIGWRLP